ncbi:MAG: recombinase family protein [Proteobacteria bacterium]|nr:recombinase family protein [Pseudomonadota bacterium]
MRVAIYARYSSDNQRDASIEDQVAICREHAKREGWTIVETYTDRAISGASLIRPGIQALLSDAINGKLDIVLAEALDRLSRDQEDIAGIYKRMSFAGVKIITLSEGEVSNLHIGLKGTMNAMFLQDLADKTRRGLRGRIERGKSGGGKCYGYDVVKKLDSNGEAVRGERKINGKAAKIVTQIFNDYAAGISPKAIAKALNAEGVPGPSGKGWGQSTINGNRERGTGILNNELYIGRLVWNRLRYLKDPETGKRVSRLNPESDWVIHEVPELAIIDADLWQAVKDRQKSLDVKRTKNVGMWDRRRPKYLFSGLLKCGVCGGGFSKISKNHFGCSSARNKGICKNMRTIRREVLEDAVLSGLRHHLMDPELCEVFAEEYTRHINKLRIDRNASLDGYKAEFERADRELDKLVDAICAGTPPLKVKDRMWELENRKDELTQLIENTEEAPVYIHPNMGKLYREKISDLTTALNDESCRTEAAEIIRGLIDRIVLNPNADKPKGLTIDLHGALAGILSLSQKSKKASTLSGEDLMQVKLVAGVGFEPTTFRL